MPGAEYPLVFHMNAYRTECPGVIVPSPREDGKVDLLCAECGAPFGAVAPENVPRRLMDLNRL